MNDIESINDPVVTTFSQLIFAFRGKVDEPTYQNRLICTTLLENDGQIYICCDSREHLMVNGIINYEAIIKTKGASIDPKKANVIVFNDLEPMNDSAAFVSEKLFLKMMELDADSPLVLDWWSGRIIGGVKHHVSAIEICPEDIDEYQWHSD